MGDFRIDVEKEQKERNSNFFPSHCTQLLNNNFNSPLTNKTTLEII